jgi:hypothetical protein
VDGFDRVARVIPFPFIVWGANESAVYQRCRRTTEASPFWWCDADRHREGCPKRTASGRYILAYRAMAKL